MIEVIEEGIAEIIEVVIGMVIVEEEEMAERTGRARMPHLDDPMLLKKKGVITGVNKRIEVFLYIIYYHSRLLFSCIYIIVVPFVRFSYILCRI